MHLQSSVISFHLLTQRPFQILLTKQELSDDYDLRQAMQMPIFFLYLARIAGVELRAKAVKGLWTATLNGADFLLLPTDITSVKPVIKRTFLSNLVSGMQSLREAKSIEKRGNSVSQQTCLRQLSHS